MVTNLDFPDRKGSMSSFGEESYNGNGNNK